MQVETEGGRVYIPKELRDRHGERFELIDRGDKLLLVPIPDDPLASLREEWSDVDKSVDELKAEATREAEDEAGR